MNHIDIPAGYRPALDEYDTQRAIEHIKRTFPENTTIWAAAIDPGLNEHKYIVPGFGDDGDLCYGTKL